LSVFPVCPQYWRATPTECVPFFRKPVSSMIQKHDSAPPRVSAGSTCSATVASTAASHQSEVDTRWCID